MIDSCGTVHRDCAPDINDSKIKRIISPQNKKHTTSGKLNQFYIKGSCLKTHYNANGPYNKTCAF